MTDWERPKWEKVCGRPPRALGWLQALVASVALLAPNVSAALTADEIMARLQESGTGFENMECRAKVHVLNRGAHGAVIQEFDERRHFWCDKPGLRVRDKREDRDGREQWWDGAKKHWKQRIGTDVSEGDFPQTIARIEDAWPTPTWSFFPATLLGSFDLSQFRQKSGTTVEISGRVKGGDPQLAARMELDVNIKHWVILEMRVFDERGGLVERTQLRRYKRFGTAWLPGLVKERRNRDRNVIDVTIRYDYLRVNDLNDTPWWRP